MNDRIAYLLGLFGHLGLLFWMMIGIATDWVELPAFLPKAIALAAMLFPLLFPLRGMLHGRAYTFAWATFMALAYFVIGVWTAAVAADRLFGIGIVAFSTLFFIGSMLYPKLAKKRATESASE